MSVTELSIQLRNTPGQIVQITAILAEADISLRAVAASSAGKSGWLRLIVDNAKLAEEALQDCGYSVEVGEAVAVSLFDEPGALDRVLRTLADEKINVDYVYTCATTNPQKLTFVIGVQTPGKAEKLLKADGIEIADIRC